MPRFTAIKTCLVVGASGFVGRSLCRHLQQQGIQVRAMLRRNQSGPWNESVFCDLETFDDKHQMLFDGIDVIFYLASIAHNKAPSACYEAFNVKNCVRFAKAALEHGVRRFVYVSSTKAMAEPGELIVDEQFQSWPVDRYGLSKRKAEEALLTLPGFEHLCIVRPCLIYGAGVQGNLLSMIRGIDRGWFPPLPATSSRRSMVSANDVARALLLVANSPQANRRIYLLTDGKAYGIKDIENAIRRALGQSIPSWQLPLSLFNLFSRLPVVSSWVYKLIGSAQYSSEKIRRELQWDSHDTFESTLPVMITTYRHTFRHVADESGAENS